MASMEFERPVQSTDRSSSPLPRSSSCTRCRVVLAMSESRRPLSFFSKFACCESAVSVFGDEKRRPPDLLRGPMSFRVLFAQSCCEFRCDCAAIPGRSSGSDSQHRCPEHRVVATLCRDSPDKSTPWGSGGRGFRSRRMRLAPFWPPGFCLHYLASDDPGQPLLAKPPVCATIDRDGVPCQTIPAALRGQRRKASRFESGPGHSTKKS